MFMNHFRLSEQVAHEKQYDLQRESKEAQQARLALDDEPRLSLLRRLFYLFGGALSARPAQGALAAQEQGTQVVNTSQLDDCVAC
jgi:hypothetical protein